MKTDQLEVAQSKLKEAYDNLDETTRHALEQSYKRIKSLSRKD